MNIALCIITVVMFLLLLFINTKTYLDTRFGVCMTFASGVCCPCSDTQPSTILRMDDICYVPMPGSISAQLSGRSILVHQAVS